MKKVLFAGVALATLYALPASAAVTASYCGPGPDNGCEVSGDAMVFLQAATDVTSGLGNIGKQNAPLIMDISSNGGMLNMFIDLKNGFATIDPTQPATSFNGLTFTVPGFEITDITFSAQLVDSTFTATAVAQGATVLPIGTFTDQPNSSQGYGVQANGGGFDSVAIAATDGFEEVKHIEVGLCQIVANNSCEPVNIPVAEPTSLALLGFGVLGLVGLRRRG